MSELSAISLFSGCGGSDLGLERAGIAVVRAIEKNRSACDFYEQVLNSDVIEQADIQSIDVFGKADILAGCYPCQGYSQGGKRKSSESINYLYREFDRALRQVKPIAFIVENVDGMRFSQNNHLLQNQLCRFRSAGYRVNWQVLDAKDYGVAQSRKRLFIVGIRSSERKIFEFPSPTHGPNGHTPYRTQRDVIWRLRESTDNEYNDEPFHWYYLSRNRRKEWDEPSATIVARDRHVGLHPDSPTLVRLTTDEWIFSDKVSTARRLSYLECAALQGFPAPRKFKSQSLHLRYRAIGNAVPPPLFEAVCKSLMRLLRSRQRSL